MSRRLGTPIVLGWPERERSMWSTGASPNWVLPGPPDTVMGRPTWEPLDAGRYLAEVGYLVLGVHIEQDACCAEEWSRLNPALGQSIEFDLVPSERPFRFLAGGRSISVIRAGQNWQKDPLG